MRRLKNALFITILMIGLAGCSSPKLQVAPVSISDNPDGKIAELAEALDDSRARQVDVLSPTWYSQAESYLEKSRSGLSSKAPVADVLENVAYGEASLDKANESAQIARSALSQAVEARDLAITAGAQVFGEDYLNAEKAFIALTTDVEKDKLSRAEKREGKVVEAFAELELRAIKENSLGGVRKQLAEAKIAGAELRAPKTLRDAQQALDESEMFINHQRHRSERIQEKADQALFQVQRLEQIMAISDQIKSMRSEEIALWNENHLHLVTSKLGAPDLRNQSPEQQVQNITESIGTLQSGNKRLMEKLRQDRAELEGSIKKLQTRLDAQDQQIALLKGESIESQKARERIARQEQEAKARLEAERRFQQLFNEVQGLFDADQADVYKQSGNLVIRLKAMQFPVGQDLIMPENYTLLNRVRKAIGTFGKPTVVIEGHTDSTGSAAINEKLSQDRAEAVRQYFIANGTLTDDEVAAVGYGPDRPLATNNTAEGRAINRRIDVIIKPMETAK